MTFKEVIKSLQNLGEINIKVSTHQCDKQDGGGILFRADKTVCFVLDAPKESKKKKVWGSELDIVRIGMMLNTNEF